MQNCIRKWCLLLCTILFEVTWAFWKMCHTKPSLSLCLLVRSKNPRVLCYKLLNSKWQQCKKKLRSCKLIYLCAFACEFSSPGDSRKLFHSLSRRKVSHPCVSSCESPILSRLGTDDRTPWTRKQICSCVSTEKNHQNRFTAGEYWNNCWAQI